MPFDLRAITAAPILRAAVFLSLLCFGAQSWAIFSDDEARRAILDLRARVETLAAKIDELEQRNQSIGRGQLELLNENERLRVEVARLRGLLEETERKTSLTGDRQKELYTDLDKRLRVLEPLTLSVNGESFQVSPAEKARFEEAQLALQNSDIPGAIAAFARFEQQFPASALAPVALLARGSALYAAKDYKQAIRVREQFINKYPTHPKKPEALLNLAAAQAESGSTAAARLSLETILKDYPDSKPAAEAKDRLKDLPRPAPAAKKEAPAKAPASKAPASSPSKPPASK